MTEDELSNWQRVKDHFETLSEDKRNNGFYKRACAIVAGNPDPIEPLPTEQLE